MPTVEIEKPPGEPLDEWFETLRTWLDRHGGAGVTFAHVGDRSDRVVYRLAVGSGAIAEKFSENFPAYVIGVSALADAPDFVALDAPA
jgi:hypothetical protein